MPITDTVRRAAWHNGQLSARLGRPVTVCPFAAQDTDNERVLARVWVSGYMAAAPPSPGAVDLGTTVEAQAEPDGDDDEPAAEEMRQVDQDHAEALLLLLAAWPALAAPLVAVLAEGATAAATSGLLGRLATLPVPGTVTRRITAAVAAALVGLADTSADRVRDRLADQGVELDAPDLDRKGLRQQARAVTGLLVAGYRSAAGRAALNVAAPDTDPGVVGNTVRRELDDMTATAAAQERGQRRGFVAGQLDAALHAAVHWGRAVVFRLLDALPIPVTWHADESNEDRNRCKPCSAMNETEFPSLPVALAAYPSGKYVGCLGRNRCRGQLRVRIRRGHVEAFNSGWKDQPRRKDRGLRDHGGQWVDDGADVPDGGIAKRPKPALGEAARNAAPVALQQGRRRGSITQNALVALAGYAADRYKPINSSLRGGGPSPDVVDEVRQIDSAMAKSPLRTDVQVERGIMDGRKVFGAEAWGVDLAGAEWTERSYLSTTTDPAISEQFTNVKGGRRPVRGPAQAVLDIRAPAGVHGIELTDHEQELLLERGLRLRVVSDSGPETKPRRLEVEVIP